MIATLHGAVGHPVGQSVLDNHFLEDREKGVAAAPLNGRTLLLVGVSGLSKGQAEDLLDWLEANHSRYQRVSWQTGKGFSVVFG
jgi:hypothetical protein